MSVPASVTALDAFVDSLRNAFAEDLVSVVLFGSAADGTARPTSDVNLLVVLRRFDRDRADRIRAAARVAEAAAHVEAMFLLEEELPRAAETFALKFADIARRRLVLYGTDPIAGLSIPRDAELRRIRQVLMNLRLRLRWLYLVRSLREEQAAKIAGDSAGPLRVAAASLYALEGTPAETPRAALERFAAAEGRPGWLDALADLRRARGGELLPPGSAPTLLLRMTEMTEALEAWALRLSA